MTKPKTPEQLKQKREREKIRRLVRMADPEYATRVREQKRISKAKQRQDPAVRAKWNAWIKQDRIKNPDKYLEYQVRYYEKRGDTPSERRKRWRQQNNDRYRAGYQESNKQRLCAVIASFRRGDITKHEFDRLIGEFLVQHNARCPG